MAQAGPKHYNPLVSASQEQAVQMCPTIPSYLGAFKQNKKQHNPCFLEVSHLIISYPHYSHTLCLLPLILYIVLRLSPQILN